MAYLPHRPHTHRTRSSGGSDADAAATEPTITLEGAPNFRDLGGYRTADGLVVRHGHVFRSGHLAKLTNDDVARLEDLGIHTVVDLRLEFEAGMFGRDRLPRGANYLSLPIAAGGMDAAAHGALRRGDLTALPDLAEANRRFVRDNTHELRVLLRTLSAPDNLPLVFHCIGGKDRSGVASAVVLSVLGVPWGTVRQDYLHTNHRLRDGVEKRLAYLAGTTPSSKGTALEEERLTAARRFFVVEPRYIDAARDEMVAMCGSLEGYVRDALGVTADEVSRLRENVLERPRAGT